MKLLLLFYILIINFVYIKCQEPHPISISSIFQENNSSNNIITITGFNFGSTIDTFDTNNIPIVYVNSIKIPLEYTKVYDSGQLIFKFTNTCISTESLNITVFRNTTSSTIIYKPTITFVPLQYPLTNTGKYLEYQQLFDVCNKNNMKSSRIVFNNNNIECNVTQGLSQTFKCQLQPGTGQYNVSIFINNNNVSSLYTQFTYKPPSVFYQNVTMIGNNIHVNLTGESFGFANSTPCLIDTQIDIYKNYYNENKTINCIIYDNNHLGFELKNASTRGLFNIYIDSVPGQYYYSIAEVNSMVDGKFFTGGDNYAIFRGQNFSEAGEASIPYIFQARLVNNVGRFVCNITNVNETTNQFKVILPPGIGNSTLYFYRGNYSKTIYKQFLIQYQNVYSPSNDSNLMTVNIIYPVIIVFAFVTIVFVIIHNIPKLRIKLEKKFLG